MLKRVRFRTGTIGFKCNLCKAHHLASGYSDVHFVNFAKTFSNILLQAWSYGAPDHVSRPGNTRLVFDLWQIQKQAIIQIIHQHTTLMSPNKGETAVCGSSIFVRMTGAGDHWLPISIGLHLKSYNSLQLNTFLPAARHCI